MAVRTADTRNVRGVLVLILRVERGGGRGVGEVAGGALERGEVEEEVGAAEVVRVGGFLRVADTGHGPPRGWSARLYGAMGLDTHDGTEQGLHFCFPERLEVELPDDISAAKQTAQANSEPIPSCCVLCHRCR